MPAPAPREVPFVERRPHSRVLVRRHAAAEHERLGAAADTRPHGAHDDVGRARFGAIERTALSTIQRPQPERMCDPAIDVLASAHCSHRSFVPKHARPCAAGLAELLDPAARNAVPKTSSISRSKNTWNVRSRTNDTETSPRSQQLTASTDQAASHATTTPRSSAQRERRSRHRREVQTTRRNRPRKRRRRGPMPPTPPGERP